MALIENDTIKWVGYPKVDNLLETEATTIASIGNGSVAMVYVYEQGNRVLGTNLLVEFTNLGKELIQSKVPVARYPRDIVFTESDNLFTCVFEDFNSVSSTTLHPIYINKINQEGGIEWEGKVEIGGEVVSLTAFDDGYIITCNVTSARTKTGKLQKSIKGNNIFIAQISNTGLLKTTYFATSDQPHFASYVINNMDEQINILGFKGTRVAQTINDQDLVLIWLDEDLELLDSTLLK